MIVLNRIYTPTETPGVWHAYHGLSFDTLELPWRENRPNVSCIPEGIYRIERDHTGRHKWFRVKDVPGRTAIELHGASSVADLKGCVGFLKPEVALPALVAMMPAGDWLWVRSDTGPVLFE